jgi:bla regulator protein blaR1
MILSWMLYGSAVAFLFGVAAASLEPVVRQRGWPTRALWGGSIIGSVALPAFALLLLPLIHRWRDARIPAPTLATEGTANWLDPLTVRVPAAGNNVDAWLIAGWSAASLALLGALVFSAIALERRCRAWRSSQVDGHEIWISADTGPAVVGFLRSRIVLPEWIAEGPPAERALAMAHEGEHIRAGDPRLIFSVLLLLTALPWNPALWWQWRRLRQAVEVDCDRRVIAQGFDPRAYGRLLVSVGEHGGAHRLAVAALTESPSLLERRIRLMFGSQPRRWGVRAAGAAVVATLSILIACWAETPTSALGPSGSTALGDRIVTPGIDEPEISYEVAQLQRPPRLINMQEAAGAMERLYPPMLKDAGIGGTVIVQFVITPEGAVDPSSLRVLDSPRDELGRATVEAVKQFRFQPGVYNGNPVRTLTQMPITWSPPARDRS